VVRNPFNVDFDASLPWPDAAEGLKLAFVGRLEPGAKGCDILLDVLSSPKWRSRAIEVTFYGEGSSGGSVKSYAESLGLGNVHFRGHVGNVLDIWKENHALLLPSRYEGLPLAAVEAMLCGRPCVVTDVGGSAELIEDDVTGFVAEAATVRHFDEAMERAWGARERLREMGERARAKVRASLPRDPAGVFAGKLVELAVATKPGRFANENLEPAISR
jgi:glycosyltransferase involved in cell wall biosynthesis